MFQKIDLKTRKILHKVHLNRIKNKKGLNRVNDYINTKTLKVKKDYFKGKICGDFGSGSHGGGGLNILKLGAKFVHLLDLNKNIKTSLHYSILFPINYHTLGGLRHFIWDKYPNLLENQSVRKSSLLLFGGSFAFSFLQEKILL